MPDHLSCFSQRHTAENIERWTADALEAIGLKVGSLLRLEDEDNKATGLDSAIESILGGDRLMLEQADLDRLGITEGDLANVTSNDFVFKKISDNGSNIKKAWDDDEGRWGPCFDHSLELCTLPFTWVQKRKGEPDKPVKGSVAESYSKGRGCVGYLHASTIGSASTTSTSARRRWGSSRIRSTRTLRHAGARRTTWATRLCTTRMR